MVEDGESRQGHGHKRRATDELERDQRLAKRFDLLNLRTYNIELQVFKVIK
jgi:hypothetical protein